MLDETARVPTVSQRVNNVRHYYSCYVGTLARQKGLHHYAQPATILARVTWKTDCDDEARRTKKNSRQTILQLSNASRKAGYMPNPDINSIAGTFQS